MANCKSCYGRIIWATNDQGRRIPFDEEPDPYGNYVLVEDGYGELICKQARDEPAIERFISHFATCPDADSWRQEKTKKAKR